MRVSVRRMKDWTGRDKEEEVEEKREERKLKKDTKVEDKNEYA